MTSPTMFAQHGVIGLLLRTPVERCNVVCMPLLVWWGFHGIVRCTGVIEVIHFTFLRPGPKPQKIAKVKKWDSFKNAFAIRHRSASPQRSLDFPTSSLPADTKKKVEVTRNRSFLEKLKLKRDRSESPSGVKRGGVALRSPEEKKDSLPRPLSENVHYSQQLQTRIVDPPTAVSVPNTPLAKKRQEDNAQEESLTPSTQTPGGSSGPSLEGTPEPNVKYTPSPKHTSVPVVADKKTPPESKTPVISMTPPVTSKDTSSAPKHTSTPIAADKGTPPKGDSSPVIIAKPRPLVNSPKTRRENVKKPTLPTPDEGALPEILTQTLAWDDIKQMLESLPEESKSLFPESDTLSPEQESWMDKDTPIEQLREFLAICA